MGDAAGMTGLGIAFFRRPPLAPLLRRLKLTLRTNGSPSGLIAAPVSTLFGTPVIIPIWYLMVPMREAVETFAMPRPR